MVKIIKKKHTNKEIKALLLAVNSMLLSLTDELHIKGIIDGEKVMKGYAENMDNLEKEFMK
jgi:hypothetical protein